MNNKDFNLEEKDIYKLFNEIKMEESEFNQMEEEIPVIQKERIKKNLNKKIKGQKGFKKLKYGSIAAAISLISIVGIGTASPAFAENIPVLSSITQTLNDKFGFHGEYEKYSQIVNKSVEDKGIDFTLNEVLADDSKVVIGYTIKSDKKISDEEAMFVLSSVKINGKMPNGSHGSSTGNYIDDYTYVGTEEIHTKIPQDSNKFNVNFNVSKIGNVKGKWNFSFSISKEELLKDSSIFKPNKKIDFPDSNVIIDKVVFSPIDTSVFLSGKSKTKRSGEHGLLDYDYWIAFDDKGTEITPKGLGGGSGNLKDGNFSCEMNYVRMKSVPKYLTIVPCKIISSGGGGVSVDKDGKETSMKVETKKPKEISKVIDGIYPIELPQGEMGKVIVKEIKTENNKTIVKYTAQGKAPYFQAQDLLIKDDQGKDIKIKDHNIRKDENNPNEFTKVFEALDPNKKYTIYTNDFSNVDFGENLKFKIDLNK
ncbi:DUF4179 domain-containing protein [Clostridium scatologenes]|uniref:DUF4179 domain-containing protein n=1 Tax=Clostridium scatologenes TaxID=1548 RepID=A0A0E3K3B6_CLOSL|nr:DUF4179 domain-containing protein [Clostridium scatologenes]AKA71483.1 hypothetical protein CSCA_4358 [Clostridium scatologenes]